MKIESVSIKNFRNFENVEISLDNKNIFFGLNEKARDYLLCKSDKTDREKSFIVS